MRQETAALELVVAVLAMANVVIYCQPAAFRADYVLFLGLARSVTRRHSLANAVVSHLLHLGFEMDGPVAILWQQASGDGHRAVIVELKL